MERDEEGHPFHRYQKPRELVAKYMKASSNPGDIVADFFIGSGTTAVVADRLGRRFFGCDIDPGCVEMALKRLMNDRALRGEVEMLPEDWEGGIQLSIFK